MINNSSRLIVFFYYQAHYVIFKLKFYLTPFSILELTLIYTFMSNVHGRNYLTSITVAKKKM